MVMKIFPYNQRLIDENLHFFKWCFPITKVAAGPCYIYSGILGMFSERISV